MKEDKIRDDFVDRTVELAMKTHEEIRKLADDYIEVKRSLGKQTSLFEYLEVYDNLTITLVRNLTDIQSKMRAMHIKRMAEERNEN